MCCFSRSGQQLASLNCLVSGEATDGPCYYEAMPPSPAMRLIDDQASSPCNVSNCNDNQEAGVVSSAELALLAKLEEANRLIESDAKSLNSLSGNSASGHSRKSSDTSQISLTSGKQTWLIILLVVYQCKFSRRWWEAWQEH